MARAPRVSVCIPTYNQTDYLKLTVESLLSQKFEDYEVVVTDDSDGDGVERLLARYDFGGRMRYRKNVPQLGSPANWNAAVRDARGEYIKLLHHDDWFPDDGALENFVSLLDRNEKAGWGGSAACVFGADQTFVRTHCANPEQLEALARLPETLYFGNWVGAPSATIYRRGIGIEYDERLKWLVDVDFYIRALRGNWPFVYSERVLICTLSGGGHQITEFSAKTPAIDLGEHLLVLERVYPRLKDHPRLVPYLRNRLSRHRIWTREALEAICPIPGQLDALFKRVFASPLWCRLRYGIPRRLWEMFRRR